MSAGEDEAGENGEQSSTSEPLYRTVTPAYFGRRDAEMDVIGWGYFLGLLVLLVPLLPFVILLWLGDKLFGLARRRGSRGR